MRTVVAGVAVAVLGCAPSLQSRVSSGNTASMASAAAEAQRTAQMMETAKRECAAVRQKGLSTEEEAATAALTKNVFQAMSNLQPEGPEQQEYRLREGQGFSIFQSTNSAVGSFAWFMVFTVDPTS